MHPEKNIIKASTCDHCGNHALWIQGQNYYPGTGNSLPANPDMPEPVLKLYNEASSISLKSPRGSAALLRLAIQILCKELGEEGKNINTDIGNLVKKGLPELVQQSLDIVRVIGNDAVHPGQIDTDEIDTVSNLFELVNVIVEYMISLPKRIGGIYSNLPNEKIKGIEDRDKK
ncbi:PF13643 domain protein [Leptospira terpstrae serovar Hualin str. LT 11-33 = ATCC 700639]|uniref:PF13643 domain protein n=2 Tax=Leptospira TaxID=171 RepID=N1VYT4_9LEPT|nr:PF13643 domain protein [Leptospira terpstrae serovar Hualin str. LT 11-33 = ATCC 700639]